MSEKVTNVTDSDFEQVVLNSSGPVLVDFWAPWCTPCKMMAPVLDSIASEYDETQLKVAKLNVDENPSTSSKYKVLSIPTLLLFKDGTMAGQLVGFMPKDELKRKLTPLL